MVDVRRQSPSELHEKEAERQMALGENARAWVVRADHFAQANAHATLALYYRNIGR